MFSQRHLGSKLDNIIEESGIDRRIARNRARAVDAGVLPRERVVRGRPAPTPGNEVGVENLRGAELVNPAVTQAGQAINQQINSPEAQLLNQVIKNSATDQKVASLGKRAGDVNADLLDTQGRVEELVNTRIPESKETIEDRKKNLDRSRDTNYNAQRVFNNEYNGEKVAESEKKTAIIDAIASGALGTAGIVALLNSLNGDEPILAESTEIEESGINRRIQRNAARAGIEIPKEPKQTPGAFANRYTGPEAKQFFNQINTPEAQLQTELLRGTGQENLAPAMVKNINRMSKDTAFKQQQENYLQDILSQNQDESKNLRKKGENYD